MIWRWAWWGSGTGSDTSMEEAAVDRVARREQGMPTLVEGGSGMAWAAV
jgi:hypothetical protein